MAQPEKNGLVESRPVTFCSSPPAPEECFMQFKLLLLAVILIIPLIPTFWAILDIPKRQFSSTRKKIMWFFAVATLPFLGAVFYITLGRRHTQPLETV